jgi:hypothetical protein
MSKSFSVLLFLLETMEGKHSVSIHCMLDEASSPFSADTSDTLINNLCKNSYMDFSHALVEKAMPFMMKSSSSKHCRRAPLLSHPSITIESTCIIIGIVEIKGGLLGDDE